MGAYVSEKIWENYDVYRNWKENQFLVQIYIIPSSYRI